MLSSSKLARIGAKAFLSRRSAQVATRGAAISSVQYIAPRPSLASTPAMGSAKNCFLSSRSSSGSPYQADETFIPGYDKFGSTITQNITHNAFAMPSSSQDDNVKYDEDYDEYNLHMTPNSITSQDNEQFSELEMIRDGDVRAQLDGSQSISYYNDIHIDGEGYRGFKGTESQDGEYEFEEDWEIMHRQNSGHSGPVHVLDEIDDVNDVVL